MRVAPVTLLASSTAATNQTSAVQSLNQIFSYSVAATFTGSPTGTVSLQASLDNTNFVDIPASDQLIADAGTTIWNVSGSNYQYFRCAWVKTGGSSGTITIICFIRGF